jgi:hypothetical protein
MQYKVGHCGFTWSKASRLIENGGEIERELFRINVKKYIWRFDKLSYQKSDKKAKISSSLPFHALLSEFLSSLSILAVTINMVN